MASFAGKVAVVTGGGRGIGMAICHALAREGAQVAVVSRQIESCSRVAEEINALYPGRARAYAVDVAQHEAVMELGKTIVADFGTVNILVNNAGITRDTLLLRMTIEEWQEVIDTNLTGAFSMVKSLLRPLMKSTDARIINITSVIGLTGNAGQANYAASKAGLIGFTKSVAKELASRKVTCNAIAPGFISTDMTHDLPETLRDQVLKQIPLQRFGLAEEVASAVIYLASAEASYVTGQVLAIDGGMTM